MSALLQLIQWSDYRAAELRSFGREASGQRPKVGHLFGLRGAWPMRFLAGHFGVGEDQIASVNQVHGDSAWVIDSSNPGGLAGEIIPGEGDMSRDHDALISNRRGVVLVIRTADCLPILIWDARRQVIGAVHAGWRGSLKAIARKTIGLMQSRFGSRPEDLQVGIGPAAGACCYEVDGPVLEPLRGEVDFWREIVREKEPGKGMLDLAGLNVRQLVRAGVPADRIAVADVCTICHPERFASYRRDGRSGDRMLSAIVVHA